MERLVCWTLMGLRTNGPLEVWHQIGSYPTSEDATNAANDPDLAKRGIVRTQIMPYYRVEDDQRSNYSASEHSSA